MADQYKTEPEVAQLIFKPIKDSGSSYQVAPYQYKPREANLTGYLVSHFLITICCLADSFRFDLLMESLKADAIEVEIRYDYLIAKPRPSLLAAARKEMGITSSKVC